jgi:pimeloyl-ACP methyl ester carboxylesterase
MHNGPVRRLAAVAACAAAAVTAWPADAADARLRFRECDAISFRCARVAVPLDRTGKTPGRIRLLVQRLRSRGKRRGATFVLAGGPGQSATAAFDGDGLGALAPAYRNRDLIVFDQRGTGGSGALRCRKLERANILNARDEAGECANQLGPKRAFYTSRDSVDDIESIRRRLGIDKIALFGTSYGTKVALGYAMTYPQHVERIVLDSVVELAGPDPLYLDSFEAAERALRALCRSGCRGITADPVADLEALVARLARGGIVGPVVRRNGRTRATRLDRGNLFAILVSGDFDPAMRAAFPAAVRSALRGDPAPILRLKRRAVELESPEPDPGALSTALYAATTCEESRLPWQRTAPFDQRRAQVEARVASLPIDVFRPFDRVSALDTDLLKLCERWPAAATPREFGPGPPPNVPVLLLEGEDDLRTPMENAARVAAMFPQARMYTVPNTGHSVLGADESRCAERAFAGFFGGGRMPRPCRRRRRAIPPVPLAPLSLKDVPPARGVRGLTGRALAAVGLTFEDVGEDLFSALLVTDGDVRGAGLRGGSYAEGDVGSVRMRGVEFVPGVRVSGSVRNFLEPDQRGRLRITGPATPNGTLVVRGRRVRGRLGKRRVRATLTIRSRGADELALAAKLPGPVRGR